ncbi:MAG: class I SAM-dependent methyltransferase [Bacteroidales bacterium]|nr:class I SAM-dependent methyltransferase [Bacteroidales bacterium]
MSSSIHTLNLTNDFAKQYDQHVSSGQWVGPDLFFKILQPFVKKGDRLLDIGIGTGLASLPFYKAGLKIYGIDGSEEMLKICHSKNIAEALIQTDISKSDLEFPDVQFDFIISHGVFHMVGDISHIIQKSAKRLKPEGFLCFTVIPYQPDKEN